MRYFFAGCSDLSEAKQRYRELAKEYHPDRPNGNGELFKIIANQYAALKNKPTFPPAPKPWGKVKQRNVINKLLKIRQKKDLKKAWVYHAYKNTLQENGQQITREDLEFIAAALDYKKGWIEFICKENGIK